MGSFPVAGRKRGTRSPQGGRGSRVGAKIRLIWNGTLSFLKARESLRKRADVAAGRDPCGSVSSSGGWGGVRHSMRSVGEYDFVSLRWGRRVLQRTGIRGFFREHSGIAIPDLSVSCEYPGDPSVDLAAGIVARMGVMRVISKTSRNSVPSVLARPLARNAEFSSFANFVLRITVVCVRRP